MLESIWTEVIKILGSALVGAFFTYVLERRRERRQRARDILDNFLRPFEGILKETHRISNELVGEELFDLEYAPSELEQHFASLPENDPRKYAWKRRVERLHEKNRQAVGLINRFYGSIVREDFMGACDRFKYHADQWEDVWKAMEGLPVTGDSREWRRAERFPADLATALQAELAEVERRVGSW